MKFKKQAKKNFHSVVIPVYNDAAGLEDTLRSLHNQTLSATQFEVIVGNDAHMPEISSVCKKYEVQEVFTKENKGSYFLRNLAVSQSEGEFISFTDADIIVPKNWLENIRKDFEKGYDYIGGQVTVDPSKIRTLTNKFVSFNEFDNEMIYKKLHFTATANVSVRRKVIETLGAFDERLFSAGDYEFGDRVYRSGLFKQHFSKSIPVIHPPRGYSAFMKKLKRISGGEYDLARLFPDRFVVLNKGIYRELREALYFPAIPKTINLQKRVLLFFLGIWFQMYRAIQNIKNSYKHSNK